jgi:hypothetical protein
MSSLRFLLLCGLLALPARAQAGQAYPNFDLRADPPSPRTQAVAGYLQAGRSLNQAGSIGHRYFYDENAHTYWGYDIVIQAEQQGNWYSVMYYDLSIGPLDFSEGPADGLHPTIWKKLPLPALPAPHGVRGNEALENVVSVDPSTGQRLIDSMYLAMAPQANSSRNSIGNLTQQFQFRSPSTTPMVVAYRGPGVLSPGDFTVPFVSGTAREFLPEDAEMTIQQARITFNEVRQQLTSSVRLVSGSLLWFYVPEHGRYVLSLLPRPKLGFVQAGEVRGGAASFTLGADRVRLESPNAIAPGKTPYLLYVLQDPAWLPTAQLPGGILLAGSVSTNELEALARK